MKTTHLLYLLGFRSSPSSAKAQKMAGTVANRYPAVTWYCPQLPPSPAQAMAGVMARIALWLNEVGFEAMAVVGSSLGGFYATWVAEKMRCKAILLNPAVDPARDLGKYIGEQTSWHDPHETFYFKPEFIEELKALDAGSLAHPKNYLTIIAKGDEVLSWQEMQDRYATTKVKLIEGSDHALSDFDDYLPDILEFLQLAA
ncbi:MAG: esterase [Vitreoscilla sp.]|nr:esterase [Polaromonas sp.]